MDDGDNPDLRAADAVDEPPTVGEDFAKLERTFVFRHTASLARMIGSRSALAKNRSATVSADTGESLAT